MKKKILILLIAVCFFILSITVVYTINPDIFKANFNREPSEPKVSASVKENKAIREEKETVKLLTKTTFVEITFNSNNNEFGFEKNKMESEGNIDSYSYIAPTGLDIDETGNVYIDDPANHNIKVYNSSGVIQNTIDISSISNNSFVTDWRVSKDGRVYILTSEALYYSEDSTNKAFIKSNTGFSDAQRLYIANTGNVSVIDISNETMNFRVRKLSRDNVLLSSTEQLNEELNMFDYEDNSGNVIKMNSSGGSAEEELQYVITYTKYPDKEFVVSFSAENEDSIKGISVLGIDAAGDIYFLKQLFKTNKGDEKMDIVYCVDKFSFIGEVMTSHEIDKQSLLATEGLTGHTIKSDYSGNIYQLNTSEEKIDVIKYSIK